MNHELEIFISTQPGDHNYKVKGDFTITCTVLDIGEIYEVLDSYVDEQYYDEGVLSQVLHELEYDKYPDLKLSDGCSGIFNLKVTSQYTKDYYGEVDLDIQIEII